MVERWIHLTELGGDGWIRPIWTAMDEAARKGKVQARGKELNELGIHLSTRLSFLPHIVERVNRATAHIYKLVEGRRKEHEFSKTAKGVGFNIDEELKYQLLIDLDSLLVELNAVCESMKKLIQKIHHHVGKPIADEKLGYQVRAILTKAGEDSLWFRRLDTHRNFFMHEAAPYVAVDISRKPYDLLVMKENLMSFEDPRKFTALSEINEIVQGFRRSRSTVKDHLIALFQ